MKNIVLPTLQFGTECAHKSNFVSNRHWGTDYGGSEVSCVVLQATCCIRNAIEGPIDIDPLLPRVAQHSQQPVFYRSTIKILDEMYDPR
jgi:hypothetical protein